MKVTTEQVNVYGNGTELCSLRIHTHEKKIQMSRIVTTTVPKACLLNLILPNPMYSMDPKYVKLLVANARLRQNSKKTRSKVYLTFIFLQHPHTKSKGSGPPNLQQLSSSGGIDLKRNNKDSQACNRMNFVFEFRLFHFIM